MSIYEQEIVDLREKLRLLVIEYREVKREKDETKVEHDFLIGRKEEITKENNDLLSNNDWLKEKNNQLEEKIGNNRDYLKNELIGLDLEIINKESELRIIKDNISQQEAFKEDIEELSLRKKGLESNLLDLINKYSLIKDLKEKEEIRLENDKEEVKIKLKELDEMIKVYEDSKVMLDKKDKNLKAYSEQLMKATKHLKDKYGS